MIAHKVKSVKSLTYSKEAKAQLERIESELDNQLAKGVFRIQLTYSDYSLLYDYLTDFYKVDISTVYNYGLCGSLYWWKYDYAFEYDKQPYGNNSHAFIRRRTHVKGVCPHSKAANSKASKTLYTQNYKGFTFKRIRAFYQKDDCFCVVQFKIHCTDANFAANLKAYPNQLKHFDTSEVSDFSPLDTDLSGFEHWNTTNINTCIAPKGAIKSKWQMIWNYEYGERQKACAALESELIALSLTDLVNYDSFFGVLNEKSLPKTILYRISDFVVDTID